MQYIEDRRIGEKHWDIKRNDVVLNNKWVLQEPCWDILSQVVFHFAPTKEGKTLASCFLLLSVMIVAVPDVGTRLFFIIIRKLHNHFTR